MEIKLVASVTDNPLGGGDSVPRGYGTTPVNREVCVKHYLPATSLAGGNKASLSLEEGKSSVIVGSER